MTPLTAEQFSRAFDEYERSAFRLETLQQYLSVSSDDRYEAFLAGRPQPPRTPETSPWLAQVARSVAAGKRIYRVHVVDQPLSPYIRYELGSYRANQAAGEKVFIADRAWHSDLQPLHTDFWLLDGARVIVMRYDHAGRYLGAEPHDAPDLDDYRARRDAAMAHAVPLGRFTARADA